MSTCKRMWTDREIRSMADESAKIRIEAGLTENAKPLYFHPITVYATTIILTMIIINNDAEAFTKNSFLQYVLDNYASVRILLNGAVKGENYYLSPSYLRVKNDVVYIVGVDNNGISHNEDAAPISFTNIVNNAATLFFDGVNKLN